MTDQKQQPWADIFRADSQKAREDMPQKIREIVLKKCGEVAASGRFECEIIREMDLKPFDEDRQGEILLQVCNRLKQEDRLDAEIMTTTGISCHGSQLIGIWVSWAKAQKSDKNSMEKE